VDLETASEKKRLALLRVLAWMALVVVLIAHAPAGSLVPQWVRSSVAALLVRVEAAATSLVIVAARVFCGHRVDWPLAVDSLHLGEFPPEEDVPAERLLHRIKALRAVLNDLPRYAKRLVKRLTRSRTAKPTGTPSVDSGDSPPMIALFVSRIKRPPDKMPPHQSGRVMLAC